MLHFVNLILVLHDAFYGLGREGATTWLKVLLLGISSQSSQVDYQWILIKPSLGSPDVI